MRNNHETRSSVSGTDAPREQILDGMLQGIRSLAGKTEQSDDITMPGITWFGTEPKA